MSQDDFLIGLDVSKWQGSVDYSTMSSLNVSWVVPKATHGARSVDSKFYENRDRIRAAGISFGAYHWFLPSHDPIEQARHFVNTVGPLLDTDIGLTVDFEDNEKETYKGKALLDPLLICMKEIINLTGRKPLLYTGKWFWASWVGFDSAEAAFYPLWHAQYPSTKRDYRPYADAIRSLPADPDIADPWRRRGIKEVIWQFDGDGGLYLTPNVDVDVNRFRSKDLQGFIDSTKCNSVVIPRTHDPVELQTALTSLGFDTKGIDGKVGPNTYKAMEDYRLSRNLSQVTFRDKLEEEYLSFKNILPQDPRGEYKSAQEMIGELFPTDPNTPNT